MKTTTISFMYIGLQPIDSINLGRELRDACIKMVTVMYEIHGGDFHYCMDPEDLLLIKMKYPKQYERYVREV